MPPKTFINPFHFVPPAKPVEPVQVKYAAGTLVAKPKPGEPFQPAIREMLHDRYAAPDAGTNREYFSGRIVCQLTTKSPCVFGNEHQAVEVKEDGKNKPETATVVQNFSIDGFAAIAATTLKGMLGTIAEMASGSAMRVLKNRGFTIRSQMTQSRSAVGMIIGERGSRKLLPLSFPTFSKQKDGEFRPTYRPTDDENRIWDTLLAQRRVIDPDATFTPVYVRKETPDEYCFHPQRRIVALPGTFAGIAWTNGRPDPNAAVQERNDVWKSMPYGELLRPVKFETLPQVEPVDDSKTQTLGIIRRLRKPHVEPRGLRFSMFIPIHREWMNSDHTFELPAAHAHLLLDTEQACQDFDFIVTDEFSNAPPPPDNSCTALRGQKQFERRARRGDKVPNAGLRHGDLVFFRPASATEVESVAISSIWREGIRWMWRRNNSGAAVADLVGPEQRPMDPARKTVTLAEKMFGWVGDVLSDEDEDSSQWVRAYKGRVRVSDAVSDRKLEEVQLKNQRPAGNAPKGYREFYPLKILSSPKPPCPEFYMTDDRNSRNRKIRNDFLASDDVHIQGWKFYVINPATLDSNDDEAWRTRSSGQRVKQKSWVRPLQCGTKFWFHVDFENLTRTELQLLCYALRPDDRFYHRCGFAKPLGLGTVQIEPLVVAYIDRWQRYATQNKLLTGGNRYTRLVGDVQQLPNDATLPLRGYAELAEQTTTQTANDDAAAAGSLAKAFADRDPDRHKVVLVAGTPPDLPKDWLGISYPRCEKQDGESDIFRWFALANRDKRGTVTQQLTSLTGPNPTLPQLEALPEPRRH